MRQLDARRLLDAVDRDLAKRAKELPDDQTAIRAMFRAYDRLRELGWREAQYCPKENGTIFEVIEAGSTGIHKCYYEGEWPDGYYCVMDDRDVYPTRMGVLLFRLRKGE